jgi:hypothetical protein
VRIIIIIKLMLKVGSNAGVRFPSSCTMQLSRISDTILSRTKSCSPDRERFGQYLPTCLQALRSPKLAGSYASIAPCDKIQVVSEIRRFRAVGMHQQMRDGIRPYPLSHFSRV